MKPVPAFTAEMADAIIDLIPAFLLLVSFNRATALGPQRLCDRVVPDWFAEETKV